MIYKENIKDSVEVEYDSYDNPDLICYYCELINCIPDYIDRLEKMLESGPATTVTEQQKKIQLDALGLTLGVADCVLQVLLKNHAQNPRMKAVLDAHGRAITAVAAIKTKCGLFGKK